MQLESALHRNRHFNLYPLYQLVEVKFHLTYHIDYYHLNQHRSVHFSNVPSITVIVFVETTESVVESLPPLLQPEERENRKEVRLQG